MLGYSRKRLMNLSGKAKRLREVRYESRPIWIESYDLLNEESIGSILSVTGEHWRYENEWRLIVELDETVGMGRKDRHGQPINLLRVPNVAVMSVYCTERTPEDTVEEVRSREVGRTIHRLVSAIVSTRSRSSSALTTLNTVTNFWFPPEGNDLFIWPMAS